MGKQQSARGLKTTVSWKQVAQKRRLRAFSTPVCCDLRAMSTVLSLFSEGSACSKSSDFKISPSHSGRTGIEANGASQRTSPLGSSILGGA
eukprot:6080104-Prymnesium_polylepis.2